MNILIPFWFFKEHFYLETQASLVVPKDAGEIEMFVSTQNPHKTQVSRILLCSCSQVIGCVVQMLAAAALGIPAHKVLTHVKRLGML